MDGFSVTAPPTAISESTVLDEAIDAGIRIESVVVYASTTQTSRLGVEGRHPPTTAGMPSVPVSGREQPLQREADHDRRICDSICLREKKISVDLNLIEYRSLFQSSQPKDRRYLEGRRDLATGRVVSG